MQAEEKQENGMDLGIKRKSYKLCCGWCIDAIIKFNTNKNDNSIPDVLDSQQCGADADDYKLYI